jgi:Cof subfamily protein (haloacid dehalogenase superfamily)
MLNHYKLLVTDIDGTILDKNGVLSPCDREALEDLLKAGVKISLCTGRAAGGCRNVFSKIPLGGFHIFFDGALVCNADQTEVIYSQPVPEESLRQACSLILAQKMSLELFSSTQYFVQEESQPTRDHAALMEEKPIIGDLEAVCRKEQIILGCIVTGSLEEENCIRGWQEALAGRLRFSWSSHPAHPGYRFINITAPEVSKGRAMEVLCSHLGVGLERVIAIGDGANDVSFLEKAGCAVAMSTSPTELKAVAHYVTDSVENNGVAKALRLLGNF